MSSSAKAEPNEPLEPKQQSLLKSSMLMASGTLLSRILGFVRSAMLITAIGAFAGTAASFQVANTLPNMVYNLLAAGILDAVLVPQIVRALRKRGGSPYVNKLITAVGTLLLLLTGVAMIGIPLLVTILAPALTPASRALTITFSLWCVPQIFFYGLYNLFGQVLNARGVFGPYMWSPVLNNVIGIISLGAFILVWGPAEEVVPVETFGSSQILVLAGSATLGVIAQALVLLIPMRRAGVNLRVDFRLKGTSFGSASKVAMWTFATLLVSQVGVISTTNIATRADAFTDATGVVVAGFSAYSYAFMIFMVPQSLITVTLVTAIFTRIANDVADGDFAGVARNYHRGLELVVTLCFASAAILMVTATPVMQLIMPNLGADSAALYGAVLVALMLGVPSTGISMMSQRVFFALENAFPVFLIGIVPTLLQLIVGWGVYFTASSEWWTVGAAAAETVARLVQGFIAVYWVSRVIWQISFTRLVKSYGRSFLAFAISGLIGWGVMHLLGPGSDSPSGAMRFFDSMWKITVVASVILLIFFAVLRLVDPEGFRAMFSALTARVRPGRDEVVDGPEPSQTLPAGEEVFDEEDARDVLSEPDPNAVDANALPRQDDVHGTSPTTAQSSSPREASKRPIRPNKIAGGGTEERVMVDWSTPPPRWDEILNPQNVGRAAARSYSLPDLSSTGAIPAITESVMGTPLEDDDLAEWISKNLLEPSAYLDDENGQ